MTVPPHVALRRVARAYVGADLYCPGVARFEVRAAAPGVPVIARSTLAPEPSPQDGAAVVATVDLFMVVARTVLHHVAVTPAVLVDGGRAHLVDPPTPIRDLARWAWWSWRLGTLAATDQEVRDLVDQLRSAHPIP